MKKTPNAGDEKKPSTKVGRRRDRSLRRPHRSDPGGSVAVGWEDGLVGRFFFFCVLKMVGLEQGEKRAFDLESFFSS